MLAASRILSSAAFSDGTPIQFVREAQLGPPELNGPAGPRPSTIVNLANIEPQRVERPLVARTRRNLGEAAGSETTGLQHVEVAAGKESAPPHCHSLEEELFVMLEGDGVLLLDDQGKELQDGVVTEQGKGVARLALAAAQARRYRVVVTTAAEGETGAYSWRLTTYRSVSGATAGKGKVGRGAVLTAYVKRGF